MKKVLFFLISLCCAQFTLQCAEDAALPGAQARVLAFFLGSQRTSDDAAQTVRAMDKAVAKATESVKVEVDKDEHN